MEQVEQQQKQLEPSTAWIKTIAITAAVIALLTVLLRLGAM